MTETSPYQPPRSSITPTAPPQFGDIQLLSAQGRLGRVRYIGYSIGLGMLVNGAMLLMGGIGILLKGGSEVFGMAATGLLIILALLALIVSILLSIQRLHDFDASGWWTVLTVVPLANVALYLVLLIMPGAQGPNRFGKPPPPNTTGVILLASILPLIFVIGIVAALAIPAYQQFHQRVDRIPAPTQP